jgi:hypothetical protein
MKKRKAARLAYLVPLGRTATFYVPAQKMNDSAFGRDGRTATQLFDDFFLSHFGGLTHEESKIRGQWTSPDGQKVFTDLHERYEVTFSGKRKSREFVDFLSDMCRLLQEDSIYVTMGDRSWLVKPRDNVH